MIRKNLVYTFKNKANNTLGLKIGNSRIHELVAAYFGFSSQAAMDAEGVLLIDDELFDESSDELVECETLDPADNGVIFLNRCSMFGLSKTEGQQLASLIHRLVTEKNVFFVAYTRLSDWELGFWGSGASENSSNFEVIERLAEKGNPDALFTLAKHFETELPDARNGYWYREKLKGRELTLTQLDFASSYESALEQYKTYSELLLRAADKGHADAAYALALMNDDDSEKWYRKSAELGNVVAQSVLALDFQEDDWLLIAAKNGDRQCLEKLTQDALDSNEVNSDYQAHKWNALAELYGFDLTQSIADNNEDFGPVFILYEGIVLPKISEDLLREAKEDAARLFERVNSE